MLNYQVASFVSLVKQNNHQGHSKEKQHHTRGLGKKKIRQFLDFFRLLYWMVDLKPVKTPPRTLFNEHSPYFIPDFRDHLITIQLSWSQEKQS